MYAIISDGAHQYRVEEGQILELQRRDLPEDAKTIEFDRVLLVGDIEEGARIGRPVVEGAKVTASVMGEFKGEKITILRKDLEELVPTAKSFMAEALKQANDEVPRLFFEGVEKRLKRFV